MLHATCSVLCNLLLLQNKRTSSSASAQELHGTIMAGLTERNNYDAENLMRGTAHCWSTDRLKKAVLAGWEVSAGILPALFGHLKNDGRRTDTAPTQCHATPSVGRRRLESRSNNNLSTRSIHPSSLSTSSSRLPASPDCSRRSYKRNGKFHRNRMSIRGGAKSKSLPSCHQIVLKSRQWDYVFPIKSECKRSTRLL